MEIEGYRSASARGRLKLFAWLIAVPLWLFQFVLLVVFAGAAVWAMIVAIFTAPRIDLESAAVHEGALWMTANGTERRDDDTPPCPDPDARPFSLLRTSLEEGAAPEQVLTVCFDHHVLRPRLVSDGGTLLWFAGDRLLRVEGGAVVSDVAAPLPIGARVIAHPSRPMAADVEEDATTLYGLEGDAWVELERRRIGYDGYDWQLVSDGARLHLFRSEGDRVMHRVEGGQEVALPGSAEAWSVTVAGNMPVVFALPPLPYREQDAEIVVYEYAEGSWIERGRRRSQAREVGALRNREAAVARRGGAIEVYELDEDGALIVRSHQGPNPMWRVALWMVAAELAPFALALLAALLISSLMRRYRVSTYREGVEYAPLWRRSIAKIVDGGISLIPFGVVLWLHRGDTAWLEGPGPMLVALGSGLGFFLLFAALEGTTGATPGKWLTGIRMTTLELEPCGMGAAVMRGLGGIVDGFLSGFVGLLVVTFSRHWQRVGDRMAGTIVIRR